MEDLEKEIKDLEEWRKMNKKLEKNYKFKDFVEAFSFVTKIALIAEKMNHHPDIKITNNNAISFGNYSLNFFLLPEWINIDPITHLTLAPS